MRYTKIIQSIQENPGDMLSLSGFLLFVSLAIMPLSNTLGSWYWWGILPISLLISLTIFTVTSILYIRYRNQLWENELARQERTRSRR